MYWFNEYSDFFIKSLHITPTNNNLGIITPETIKNLELFYESWKNILYNDVDFHDEFLFLYECIECRAFDCYAWYMRLAYKGVIEQLKCDPYIMFIDNNVYLDFRWVRYANNSIFLFIIYITIIYTCSYGVNTMSINNNFSELNGSVFSNLDEVEEECGQLEDLITFFSYFLVFILLFC